MSTRQTLLHALEQVPGVTVIASRRLEEDRRRQRLCFLDLVRCRRPCAYLVILSSARRQVVCIEEFASYHEAKYHFDTEGAPVKLPPAVAAALASQQDVRHKLIRDLLQIPGVDIRNSKQRVWSRRRRRYDMFHLIECKRPRAYLLIESWRDHVINVETFASYLEAWYHFDTLGAALDLPPAVAALVR